MDYESDSLAYNFKCFATPAFSRVTQGPMYSKVYGRYKEENNCTVLPDL